MLRYNPSAPRAVIAAAAFATSAITLSLTILLPAMMDPVSTDARLLAASTADGLPVTMVAMDPRCTETRADREPKSESAWTGNHQAKNKQHS